MNEHDRKIFDAIKEQSEKDKKFWNDFNADENALFLSDEQEDEIMERMFLVYYVEKYLKLIENDTKRPPKENRPEGEIRKGFII